MRTSRAGSRESGLSLIELMVAITIVSLIAAVTVPAFDRALDNVRFDAAARTLINGLKQARSLAVSTQHEVALTLDITDGTVLVGTRTIDLRAPAGTAIELSTAQSEASVTSGRIRFFADGSSTGGRIRLAHDRKRHIIDIDWMTGRTELAQ